MSVLKPKKCNECKSNYIPKYPLQKVCSVICALLLNKKKEANKAQKDWNVKKKQIKEKLKTLSDYKREARDAFQAWINKRDTERNCISCQVSLRNKPRNASHYFSANQFSGLIFYEPNVHSSCIHCNQYLHGNLIEYRKGLILRYGEKYVIELELKADHNRVRKWTKEELIYIKNKYTKLLKDEKN